MIFQETQSKLQKGFTSGCSSLNAAFILTECILATENYKQELFVTTLGTQKAFDMMDQNSLFRKLYQDGIHGDDWLLLNDLYSDCSSRTKWVRNYRTQSTSSKEFDRMEFFQQDITNDITLHSYHSWKKDTQVSGSAQSVFRT